MTTTTEETKIHIALSDRPPVRVAPKEWPVIARASWHDGEVEDQANETAFIKVREHADGRRLVYGQFDTTHRSRASKHAGFLLPDRDSNATVRAIRRVDGVILSPDDPGGPGINYPLGDYCIADLPAEDL